MNYLIQIDNAVFHWINSGWSNCILDFIMPFVTHLGDSYVVWLWIVFLCVITAWQLLRLSKRDQTVTKPKIVKMVCFAMIYMALIFGLNAGACSGLKHLFHRPRPFVQQDTIIRVSTSTASALVHNGSFPSGHACNAFMIAALFAAIFRHKRYFFYIIATMIALSRVYLGVHYPVDVVVGGLLGFIITWLMIYLAKFGHVESIDNLFQFQRFAS